MTTRRDCLVALALALWAPFSAFAQGGKELPRIGYMSGYTSQTTDLYFDNFQRYMRELGYIDGRNIVFDVRYSQGQRDRMPVIADELVQQKVRVLIAPNNGAIEVARKATTTIPIVMHSSIDPVAAGYVATL